MFRFSKIRSHFTLALCICGMAAGLASVPTGSTTRQTATSGKYVLVRRPEMKLTDEQLKKLGWHRGGMFPDDDEDSYVLMRVEKQSEQASTQSAGSKTIEYRSGVIESDYTFDEVQPSATIWETDSETSLKNQSN